MYGCMEGSEKACIMVRILDRQTEKVAESGCDTGWTDNLLPTLIMKNKSPAGHDGIAAQASASSW